MVRVSADFGVPALSYAHLGYRHRSLCSHFVACNFMLVAGMDIILLQLFWWWGGGGGG